MNGVRTWGAPDVGTDSPSFAWSLWADFRGRLLSSTLPCRYTGPRVSLRPFRTRVQTNFPHGVKLCWRTESAHT